MHLFVAPNVSNIQVAVDAPRELPGLLFAMIRNRATNDLRWDHHADLENQGELEDGAPATDGIPQIPEHKEEGQEDKLADHRLKLAAGFVDDCRLEAAFHMRRLVVGEGSFLYVPNLTSRKNKEASTPLSSPKAKLIISVERRPVRPDEKNIYG